MPRIAALDRWAANPKRSRFRCGNLRSRTRVGRRSNTRRSNGKSSHFGISAGSGEHRRQSSWGRSIWRNGRDKGQTRRGCRGGGFPGGEANRGVRGRDAHKHTKDTKAGGAHGIHGTHGRKNRGRGCAGSGEPRAQVRSYRMCARVRDRTRRRAATGTEENAGAGTGPPPGVVKNGAETAPEAARLRE